MIATVVALLLASPSFDGTHVQMMQQLQEPPPEIVVTGRRIEDFRRLLQDCLARTCPTNEDVDATMALAEALFIDGEYEGARRVVRASIGRNRRHAVQFPEPVADLYRGNSRLARHLGIDREGEHSIRETLRVLKEGIPAEDHRHFGARLEIAQWMVAFGRYDQAVGQLQELASLARAAGRQDVVDAADLRQLWIGYMVDPHGRAARRLTAIAEGREAASPALATGARQLMVRIYGERGDIARAQTLMAELSRTSRSRQLLFAPPYELSQREDMTATPARQSEMLRNSQGSGGRPLLTANLQDRSVPGVQDKWVDVAFWVTPDGRVEDLEVVRRGDRLGGWERPLLDSIRGRRYTMVQNGERSYRLERYTYTSELRTDGTGTRTAQRSPRFRVEYLDLTSDGIAPN